MGIVKNISQNQIGKISDRNLNCRLRQKRTIESVQQCVVAESPPCLTDVCSKGDCAVLSVIAFEVCLNHKTGLASLATLLHVSLSEIG